MSPQPRDTGDGNHAADEEPGSRPPAPAVDVELHTPHDDPSIEGWLNDQTHRLLDALGEDRPGASVAVALVGDSQMLELHTKHKDQPCTTDVLSFDLRDQAEAPLEVELIVCLDEAKRQAQTRGHELRFELLLYVLHGLLHMLGFDDQSPQEAARMHAREDELLTEIGFGPVYDRPPQSEQPGE